MNHKLKANRFSSKLFFFVLFVHKQLFPLWSKSSMIKLEILIIHDQLLEFF